MILRVCLSFCFFLLHTSLASVACADEFDALRDALKRAWEPFTHYSAEIHALSYQSTDDNLSLQLIGEATCTVEIQQDSNSHRSWCREVTRGWVIRGASQTYQFREESAHISGVEGARMKEIIGPNGEVHSGYLSNGVSETFGPEFEICYPHAVMMRSLPSYWRWPGNSFVYSGPVEDYQGLPGMRMTVQAIDVTLWFSPEHDLFPIRSLQCSTTPDKWVYRSIHTVQEFGTAEYKDLSVYYPKNYTYETLARGSNTFCRKYVMDIRSIQFHEFDPQLHPAVTFPRGMQVFDYRNQDAHVEYRTLFRETHPGGYWNSYTIANAIVYGIMIAILPGIWLIVRLHKKFRAERRNL